MSDEPVITSVTTEEKSSKPWLFKPGNNANPRGRPKGARNKLGEAFVEAMLKDFEEHGEAVIQNVRTEKPDQYLKVIASILPKELNVTTNRVEEMSDDELAAGIAALQSILAASAARAGDEAPAGPKPPQGVQTLQ